MKCGAIVSLIFGFVLCAYHGAAAAAAEPAGDYSAGGLTLRFEGGGAMQLRQGDKILVTGRYTVSGDKITLVDESGPMACDAAQARGEYRWKSVQDTLTFVVIDDPCTGRAGDLPRAWTRAR